MLMDDTYSGDEEDLKPQIIERRFSDTILDYHDYTMYNNSGGDGNTNQNDVYLNLEDHSSEIRNFLASSTQVSHNTEQNPLTVAETPEKNTLSNAISSPNLFRTPKTTKIPHLKSMSKKPIISPIATYIKNTPNSVLKRGNQFLHLTPCTSGQLPHAGQKEIGVNNPLRTDDDDELPFAYYKPAKTIITEKVKLPSYLKNLTHVPIIIKHVRRVPSEIAASDKPKDNMENAKVILQNLDKTEFSSTLLMGQPEENVSIRTENRVYKF